MIFAIGFVLFVIASLYAFFGYDPDPFKKATWADAIFGLMLLIGVLMMSASIVMFVAKFLP